MKIRFLYSKNLKRLHGIFFFCCFLYPCYCTYTYYQTYRRSYCAKRAVYSFHVTLFGTTWLLKGIYSLIVNAKRFPPSFFISYFECLNFQVHIQYYITAPSKHYFLTYLLQRERYIMKKCHHSLIFEFQGMT